MIEEWQKQDVAVSETQGFRTPFQVGTTLRRAFSTYLSNFISFNLMGLIVGLPGLLLVVLFLFAIGFGFFAMLPAEGVPVEEMPDFGFIHLLGFIGVLVLVVSIQYLMVAVIVDGTLQHLGGRRPRMGAALRRGLGRIVPVVLVAFITGVLFSVGWMFFVVPGIIFALMFCVAVPVVMAEGKGVFASLARSRALTRGQRWRLLGLFILALVLSFMATAVLIVPLQLLTLVAPELSVIAGFAQLALQLFITVFFAVLLGVVYHDLRVAKEGVSTDQVAAVFD